MRRLLLTTVFVLSAAMLAGCSAGSGVESASLHSIANGAAEPAPGAVGPVTVGGAKANGSVVNGNSVGTNTVAAPSNRQVITTGQLSLTVKHPADAADEAVQIVERAGGRVDQRTEKPPVKGDQGSAQLTVRIPTAVLTATLNDVKKLGTVQDISLSSQDVTAQAQDLGARITALQTSVDRLVALMAKAASTADLITIESALSERQANVESLQAQKRSLDGQVDLATINLDLRSEADAPAAIPNTFLTGLSAGWGAFVSFFAATIVVLGVLAPWIVLAGLLGGAALVIVRVRRKRGVVPAE